MGHKMRSGGNFASEGSTALANAGSFAREIVAAAVSTTVATAGGCEGPTAHSSLSGSSGVASSSVSGRLLCSLYHRRVVPSAAALGTMPLSSSRAPEPSSGHAGATSNSTAPVSLQQAAPSWYLVLRSVTSARGEESTFLGDHRCATVTCNSEYGIRPLPHLAQTRRGRRRSWILQAQTCSSNMCCLQMLPGCQEQPRGPERAPSSSRVSEPGRAMVMSSREDDVSELLPLPGDLVSESRVCDCRISNGRGLGTTGKFITRSTSLRPCIAVLLYACVHPRAELASRVRNTKRLLAASWPGCLDAATTRNTALIRLPFVQSLELVLTTHAFVRSWSPQLQVTTA